MPTRMTINDRFEYYSRQFEYSPETIKNCYELFLKELQLGLEAHEKSPSIPNLKTSSLSMLDTCITSLPTRREKGNYFALDFGGTNARALCCQFDGNGSVKFTSITKNLREIKCDPMLPRGLLDRHATATQLFDVLADCVNEALIEAKVPKNEQCGIGFTFSFPVNQLGVNSAQLTCWTKDFETGNATEDAVVGSDVGALLDRALERKKVNAKTTVILNDTVGCMLAGSYMREPEDPPCLVGIILGTGMNGAYARKSLQYGYKGIVINTELANFNKGLVRNEIDFEVDYNSSLHGHHLLEKMASGMYIVEIIRLAIARILQQEAPEQAWIPNSLSGEGCSTIFNHPEQTNTVLQSEWGWQNASAEHVKYIHGIVRFVYKRAAALAAIIIAGMCKATGCLQPAMGGVTVGVDGSLYLNNPEYRDMIRENLKYVFDEEVLSLIKFVNAPDGSGLGAAVSAACLDNSK